MLYPLNCIFVYLLSILDDVDKSLCFWYISPEIQIKLLSDVIRSLSDAVMLHHKAY